MSPEPKIFLSYCWANRDVADSIDSDFNSIGITFKRDVRDAAYRTSIKELMKQVGTVDFVLLLVSKEYLQSSNCMYEVLELVQDPLYRKRILPIVLPGTDIFNPHGRSEYIKYWEDEIEKLNITHNSIRSNIHKDSITNDLKHYTKILHSIDGFMDTLKDLNCLTFKDLKKQNYKPILDLVGFDDKELLREILRISNIEDKEEQELELETIFQQHPKEKYILHFKAEIANVNKKYKQERKYYEELLKHHPDYALAHNNYANLLTKHFNEYALAKTHFEKALELNPDFALAHNNYANLLTKHFNEHALAKTHYEKALELNPDFALAHNNYAILLTVHFNEHALAKTHYEKAIELNPDSAEAHNNYANLLTKHFNEYALAKTHFEKAIELNPDFALAHNNYAILLRDDLNQPTLAEKHFAMAKKLKEGKG